MTAYEERIYEYIAERRWWWCIRSDEFVIVTWKRRSSSLSALLLSLYIYVYISISGIFIILFRQWCYCAALRYTESWLSLRECLQKRFLVKVMEYWEKGRLDFTTYRYGPGRLQTILLHAALCQMIEEKRNQSLPSRKKTFLKSNHHFDCLKRRKRDG